MTFRCMTCNIKKPQKQFNMVYVSKSYNVDICDKCKKILATWNWLKKQK